MLSEHGRSSPSFVVALVVLALGVGGYAASYFFKTNPYAASDRIVRSSRKTLGREVRAYQRQLRELTSETDGKAEEAIALIEKGAAEAVARIEEHAEAAHDELAELDIAFNTLRNRADRLEARTEEAKKMIAGLAEEAKAEIRGE